MFAIFTSPILNATFYVISLCALFYLWMKQRYQYWEKRGLPSLPTTYLLGNMGPAILQKTSFGFHAEYLYSKSKHHPCVGIYFLHKPVLFVNDPELVKKVLQKDYFSFQGHGFKANKEVNPLAQHLFNLEGEEWKRMRVKLTPTFTSSKMKFMFDTMAKCSNDMLEFIKEDISTNGTVVEMKEVLAKFSTDVIGSCAFGLQMNSFKDPDAEFRKMGKRIFKTTLWESIVITMAMMWPTLVEKSRLRLGTAEVSNFFINLVRTTIKYREDHKVIRNDFIQLLMDLQKQDAITGDVFTIEELTAQVFVFFIAGFETSSTTASYALLELAKNPDVQEKLRSEIENSLSENDGKITYELVHRMEYLNNVIQESLRMYPVVPLLSRFCSSNYTIPETKTVIEKGTMVMIPVLGIHRDPNIYPEPLKFDPDRFEPDNVQKRHPFTYIPFGEGPRICIGSRFGMMQVKLSILTIILHFDISLVDNSPIKFTNKGFLLHCVGGINLRLTKRT